MSQIIQLNRSNNNMWSKTEIVEMCSTHMYRHVSELKNQLKGGYLAGTIQIPDKPSSYTVELSLAPSENNTEPYCDARGKSELNFHPNLLFLAKKKTTRKRRKNGENDSLDTSTNNEMSVTRDQWRIRLEKRGMDMFYNGEKIENCLMKDDNNRLLLSLGGKESQLLLSILTPLVQKGKAADSIHVSHVLEDIIDCNGEKGICRGWNLSEMTELFLKKKISMNEVRLRVRIVDGAVVRSEKISKSILNTKHKSTVPIQVEEVYCGEGICVEKRENKCRVILKNSTNEISAGFVILPNVGPASSLLGQIAQIPKPVLKHGIIVELILPGQSPDIIKSIHASSLSLCLVLSRDSRGTDRSVPIPVPYQMHGDNNHCCCCNVHPWNVEITSNNNARCQNNNNNYPVSPADSGFSDPRSPLDDDDDLGQIVREIIIPEVGEWFDNSEFEDVINLVVQETEGEGAVANNNEWSDNDGQNVVTGLENRVAVVHPMRQQAVNDQEDVSPLDNIIFQDFLSSSNVIGYGTAGATTTTSRPVQSYEDMEVLDRFLRRPEPMYTASFSSSAGEFDCDCGKNKVGRTISVDSGKSFSSSASSPVASAVVVAARPKALERKTMPVAKSLARKEEGGGVWRGRVLFYLQLILPLMAIGVALWFSFEESHRQNV